MDFSTDSRGNVLSMNYSETGGYHGELFAVTDNSGNVDAWTSILGINNYAAIRDPNTAYIDPIEIHIILMILTFHLVGMERKDII